MTLTGIICSLIFAGSAFGAGPMLKSIETRNESNAFILKVLVSERVTPKIFSITRDNRNMLVMDFIGAVLDHGIPNSTRPNYPGIKKIRVGVHKDKIRVVIDLYPENSFDAEQFVFDNAYVLKLIPSDF